MSHIPFCCFRHALASDQGNDTVDDDAAYSIEDPNANADDQCAHQIDDGVVDHLALCRPYDFFQLALHFTEPAAETLASAGKEVFLFRFCHDVHPFCLSDVLLRLAVHSLLFAESAILFQFDTVGVVFLVLHGVVVSLLALVASERDLNSHIRHLLNTCLPAKLRLLKI